MGRNPVTARLTLALLLLAAPAWAQTVEGIGPMGPMGPAGPAGASVTGPAGKDSTVPGPTGPGYTSAVINSSGRLIVTKTDGSTVDLGAVIGPVGPAGASVKGDKGDTGAMGAASTVPGPQGPAGASITGAAGPAGPAGIVPFYGPAGLLANVRCWQGTATTAAGGAWSVNYASAGFTAPPNVQSQAISPSGLLSGLLFSTTTAPTATGAAGVTALAGVGGLGGAGAVVQVRACGS